MYINDYTGVRIHLFCSVPDYTVAETHLSCSVPDYTGVGIPLSCPVRATRGTDTFVLHVTDYTGVRLYLSCMVVKLIYILKEMLKYSCVFSVSIKEEDYIFQTNFVLVSFRKNYSIGEWIRSSCQNAACAILLDFVMTKKSY